MMTWQEFWDCDKFQRRAEGTCKTFRFARKGCVHWDYPICMCADLVCLDQVAVIETAEQLQAAQRHYEFPLRIGDTVREWQLLDGGMTDEQFGFCFAPIGYEFYGPEPWWAMLDVDAAPSPQCAYLAAMSALNARPSQDH